VGEEEMNMVWKKKFDWKITAKKVLRSAAIVLLTGILAVYSEEPLVLVLIPLIEGVLNWLKHK
jgi:uncharacterized membrane protein